MTLQSGKIDQKEYLKRYLSGGAEEKKKKKKKIATGIKRVKIIDDDLDLKNMRNLNNDELELYQLSEDAPVIAGVVDERPLEVQLADRYKDNKWKAITGGSDDDIVITDKNQPKSKTREVTKSRNYEDSDMSPPRKSKHKAKKPGADFSPPRKSRNKSIDSDQSPPRKSSKKSRQNSDSDISPPRKSVKKPRQNSDSDISPPRKSIKKSRQNSDSDISPPRKSVKKSRQKSDSDISPPRKSIKKSRQNSDSDLSPPRKSKKQINSSSKHSEQKNRTDSPSRRSRRNSDSDLSPPRRKSRKDEKPSNKYKSNQSSDSDLSPPRKSRKAEKASNIQRSWRNGGSDSDLSPPRRQSGDKNKMKKTLDGKQAGLQDAKQLVQENQEFKRREDELFRQMKASVSGAEARTVLRDRKTGKVRDLEEEARIARKREEKDSEHKDKYDRWGRGVKQGEDFQARIANDLHEMSKPLARYRDDEDLERDLKETLRAEDPMLQYVLSKKEKAEGESKPKYKGAWPPNRFNIPPGYRWDGVDRSNGYEKQYFLTKSAKKATEEEAYHWSTSDM
ncbi:hypothetical protein M8J77_020636 [Diaphorina citri]|nr:hypothetical protein M8J77_020636 [Diaphorina citri]